MGIINFNYPLPTYTNLIAFAVREQGSTYWIPKKSKMSTSELIVSEMGVNVEPVFSRSSFFQKLQELALFRSIFFDSYVFNVNMFYFPKSVHK